MILASTSDFSHPTGTVIPVIPRRLPTPLKMKAPYLEPAFSGACSVAEMVGTWHIVYTRPNREVMLTHELRAKGISVYLPLVQKTYVVTHRTGTRKIIRPVPYFSRYVAICGDAEARYQAAISEHKSGVIDVPNQAKLVSELRVIEAALRLDDQAELFAELPEGCQCRVKAGPWLGKTGLLIKRRPAGQNFLIYIECFGQSAVPLEIDPAYLEPDPDAVVA